MAIAPKRSGPALGSPAPDNPGRAANSQMLVNAREEAGGQLSDRPACSPQINPSGVERMASSRFWTCAQVEASARGYQTPAPFAILGTAGDGTGRGRMFMHSRLRA